MPLELFGLQVPTHSDLITFLYEPKGETYDKACKALEANTGLKREQAAYGLFAVLGLYLIFGALAQFVCNLIGFAYPAYASVKAIRTSSKDDDTQWLIYWTVFAFFSIIDFFTDGILSIFPFYFVVKVLFLLYLYLPQTRGASYLYTRFIDPAITEFDKWLAKQGSAQGSASNAASLKKD
ncbi:unnamed protein product, partial [Mesorhabditis spiculigera]